MSHTRLGKGFSFAHSSERERIDYLCMFLIFYNFTGQYELFEKQNKTNKQKNKETC